MSDNQESPKTVIIPFNMELSPEFSTTMQHEAESVPNNEQNALNNAALARVVRNPLGILLSRVEDGDSNALGNLVTILNGAIGELEAMYHYQPRIFVTVASENAFWPVKMSRIQRKIDDERARLDEMKLGEELHINVSPLQKWDWNEPFMQITLQLVGYIAESQKTYLAWKKQQTAGTPTDALPAWVSKLDNLPEFSRQSLQEWKDLAGAVFHHRYPHLDDIPEHLVKSVADQPSRKEFENSESRIRNAFLDTIKKRMDSLVGKLPGRPASL